MSVKISVKSTLKQKRLIYSNLNANSTYRVIKNIHSILGRYIDEEIVLRSNR